MFCPKTFCLYVDGKNLAILEKEYFLYQKRYKTLDFEEKNLVQRYYGLMLEQLTEHGSINFKLLALTISDESGIDCEAFDEAAEMIITLNEDGVSRYGKKTKF